MARKVKKVFKRKTESPPKNSVADESVKAKAKKEEFLEVGKPSLPEPEAQKKVGRPPKPSPMDKIKKGFRVEEKVTVYMGNCLFETYEAGHYYPAGSVTYAKIDRLKKLGVIFQEV